MGLSNYSSTNRSKRSNLETNIVDDKQTQKTTHNRSENQSNQAINGRRNTRNSLSRSLLVETVDNNTNTKKLSRQISLRESKLPTSPPKTRTRVRSKQAIKIDEAQKDAPKEEPPKEKKTGRNRTTSDQEVTNTQRLIKRRVTLGPSEIKAIREKSIAKTTPSTNKTPPNKAAKSDKQEVDSTTSTIEPVKDRLNHHQTHHGGANNVTEEVKEVRVPGFRITAPIRPGYRLEGTEDTTDDCYLKRHQKYEAEEIRIKRWDMRRQKEEFERNKLLKGRYYSKSNISASNSKTSKSSASSSSSSAPPSADPSNSSLAASDFKPVLGPYGIYYKKFDPLQIDEIHSIQVIQFDPKSIPQPQPELPSSVTVTVPKPIETQVEPEQQTSKKTHHGKKNQHQSTTPDTNTQQLSTATQNRSSLTSQSPQTQPEASVRRKRARVSSSASYQQENKVSNENTSENLHRPSKPASKHSTGQKSARGPLNSVTNHLPVRVFESVSNHSVYDDLDLDYMSSSTNSIDDSFSMRLNPQMKRKSLPAAISTNRIVLTGKSMPRKRARLT